MQSSLPNLVSFLQLQFLLIFLNGKLMICISHVKQHSSLWSCCWIVAHVARIVCGPWATALEVFPYRGTLESLVSYSSPALLQLQYEYEQICRTHSLPWHKLVKIGSRGGGLKRLRNEKLFIFIIYLFIYLFLSLVFSGSHPQHVEVPRVEV